MLLEGVWDALAAVFRPEPTSCSSIISLPTKLPLPALLKLRWQFHVTGWKAEKPGSLWVYAVCGRDAAVLNLPKAEPALPKAERKFEDDSGVDKVRDKMGTGTFGPCCKERSPSSVLEGSLYAPPPSTAIELIRGRRDVVGSDGREYECVMGIGCSK